ncbi:MAG: hypothetical protein P4L81_04745 [Candidatus Pacebacteria bacterium]|nr:hypothetical protein [Candidatus Paceibacterota bacterium]
MGCNLFASGTVFDLTMEEVPPRLPTPNATQIVKCLCKRLGIPNEIDLFSVVLTRAGLRMGLNDSTWHASVMVIYDHYRNQGILPPEMIKLHAES